MIKKIAMSMTLGLTTGAFVVGGLAIPAQADYYTDVVQAAVPDPQQQDKCYEVSVLRFHYDDYGRLRQIETVTYTQYKPLLSCLT